MKHKKLCSYFTFLLCFGVATMYSQQSIPAAGGNATGGGGSASYAVGQVFYTTNTGAGGSISQGVQIPYEITVVTGTEVIKGIDLGYSVFPNPTTDYLTLKIEGESMVIYNLMLLDTNGKLLLSKSTEGSETKIEMQKYPSSTYFLKVTDKTKVIKTFKIIKN